MTNSTHADTFVALLNEKFKNEGRHAAKCFSVAAGRKYDKIVQEQGNSDFGHQQSVHAFVERVTGNVFKAAGWQAPAKGVRFTDVETAALNADLYGGYLYMT